MDTVNIDFIAKKAGCSPATVSRVLNKSKRVSSELEQRVYDVIAKYDYHPNAMARGRAMIPTMMPAIRSDTKSCLLYLPFLNSPKNLGLKTSLKLYFTVNTTFWAQNQRHQNEKNTGRL